MSRSLWQWVRRQIYADVVAAGFADLNPAHVERQGYLSREPDPIDSRSRRIRLTDLGHELEDTVWRAAAAAERTAAALLGEDRLQELRRTLLDLVTLLGLSGETVAPQEAPLPPDRREDARQVE
jgi:hypothetical protein